MLALCLFTGTSQAVVLQGIWEPPSCEREGGRGCCQVPRLVEAEKPVPPTNLDDCEDEAFDEGYFGYLPAPGEESWMPDTDDEAGVAEQKSEEPYESSSRVAVDDWWRMHAT